MGDVFDQLDAKPQGDVFDTATAAPDTRSLLDHLANDPNTIPLDSYTHATEHGIASIGQGVAQAVQGVGNLVRHPIDSLKGVPSAVGALPSQAAALDKDPPTLEQIGDVAGQAAGQIIPGVVAARIPFVGKSAINTAKTLSDVPAAVSADTGSTFAAVADREGLPPLQSETAREAAEELQQSFVDRAKSQYQTVDKAVGGDLKPVQEKITALKKAIRVQSNVNPDLADKYIDDLAVQQKTLQGLVEKAKTNGVPNAQELMDAGDKDYAKGMAMKKVSGGIKTASGVVKSGGHPNPTLFANQVDRLYNTGTLERAIGQEGAKALQDVAKKGLSKAKTAGAIKKTAVAVGAGAAATVGGTLAYHGIKNVLGGPPTP
jgi:hypothetical protein